MKNLGVLLSLYMKSFLGVNKARFTQDKKERNRTIISIVVMIFVACEFAFMFSMQMGLVPGFDETTGFGMAHVMTFIIALMSGIGSASSELMGFRDHDMLLAMPIKKSSVIVSRVIYMYASYMVYSVMFVPGAYITCAKAGFLTGGLVARSLLLILLMPAVPTMLCSIVSLLVSYLSSRFRLKNIIQTFASFISMILLLGFIFYTSFTEGESGGMGFSGMTSWFGEIYPPAVWFTDAIRGNVGALLKFVGVSVAAFALSCLILYVVFDKLYDKLNTTALVKDKGLDLHRRSTLFGSLYKKEIKMYFSSPLYATNTIVGYALCLIGVIALVIFRREVVTAMVAMDMENFLPAVLGMVLVMFIGLAPTTSSAISAEGSSLWILTSLPIREIDVFKAKLAMQFTLSIPVGIVASIVIPLALGLDLIWMPVYALLLVSDALLFGVAGLMMNLLHPKLDWKNEAEYCKQGMSVMLSMLVSLGASLIPGMLAIIFAVSSQYLSMLIYAIWSVLILIGVTFIYGWLKKNGAVRFRTL